MDTFIFLSLGLEVESHFPTETGSLLSLSLSQTRCDRISQPTGLFLWASLHKRST